MTETDLFGNPIKQPPPPRRKRPETNDIELIEHVLRVARTEGYAVIGIRERVYRIEGKYAGMSEIVAAPESEADAVHQLIDRGVLTVGGVHQYRYRNHREGAGRAVLVPTPTRRMSYRWDALHRPASWAPRAS